MNARFVDAALACGAPTADIPAVQSALETARPPADRSLRFTRFTADEVYQIILKRIPPKPSKDVYGISMRLLNMAAGAIAPILTELFNRCLQGGAFPACMKLSKVSPIFKGKGRRADMDSYRPVSIIPAIAKVMENGISSRLSAYLNNAQLLSDRQFAYREGKSTTSLAREVLRQIMDARERKQQVAIICCDLSKAFDVADHAVLTAKLEHYGIKDTALKTLTNMMRLRSQVVVGEGGVTKSNPLTTTMGVAQGSAVSNILFSVLLNDLPEAISTAEVLMYADDVAAVVTAATIDALERKLNLTATKLAEWFKCNGLVLNTRKSHFMHVCLSGRIPRSLTVFTDGTPLEQMARTTFLGFELDRTLTWESHIDKVCGKLGGACYALSRLSRFLPRSAVRSCYFATVHSLLQYGAELWGRAADWERAFRMQKRAVRAIVKIPQDESARPYFKELEIMTLPSIVIFQVAVYVRTNRASFSKNSDSHEYKTRRADKLTSLSCTLAKSGKLTHIMGPTVYNGLPSTVTEATSMASFKLKLKHWLICNTFYSYEEFVAAAKSISSK